MDKLIGSRRELLKAAGGVTIGTVGSIGSVQAAPSEDIQRGRSKVLEFSWTLESAPEDAVLAGMDRPEETFKTAPDRVFITDYGNEDIRIGDDGLLVSTPQGLTRIDDQNPLEVRLLPTSAKSTGGATHVADTDWSTSVTISATERAAQLVVDGNEALVRRNKTGELQIPVSFTYENRAGKEKDHTSELVFSISYHGKKKVVGHTDNKLYPHSGRLGKMASKVVEQAEKRDTTPSKLLSSPTKERSITFYPGARAFSISEKQTSFKPSRSDVPGSHSPGSHTDHSHDHTGHDSEGGDI